MTDLSSVDPSQEDEDGVLAGDQPTEPSSTDDQATGKLDTVENDVIPSAVSEVARPVAAPPPAEDQTTKELRYTNPHGTFITGIDVSSEEAALKRSQRAARFGLSKDEEEGGGGVKEGEVVEKREARAKRFGTKLVAIKGEPVKLVDKLPDIPEGDLRPEVIHLHGTDEMSTKDIFAYFKAYAPRNIEWINDSSCNAVWEDADSAYRALHGLTSEPVALRSKFTEDCEMMETDTPNETESGATEVGGANMEGGASTEGGASADVEGESEVQWRLGAAYPKAKQLLLRFAVGGDEKVSGASRQSNYYRKYGNPNKMTGKTWKTSETLRDDTGVAKQPAGGGSDKTWTEDDGDDDATKIKSGPGKSWREKPTTTDLRQRLGKRDREEEEEGMDTREVSIAKADPLASLVKRPKPLHSERLVEEVEGGVYVEESEKERMVEVVEITKADLRKKLQKNRKRRELKLRVGNDPRLVERTL